MSKFKKGDYVMFDPEGDKDIEWLTKMGVDISKTYQVLRVRWDNQDSTFLYWLNFTNGKDWGETWLCLDKRSVVLGVIKDLLNTRA